MSQTIVDSFNRFGPLTVSHFELAANEVKLPKLVFDPDRKKMKFKTYLKDEKQQIKIYCSKGKINRECNVAGNFLSEFYTIKTNKSNERKIGLQRHINHDGAVGYIIEDDSG